MALFLVLTMAPFVLLAPLIGPLLDRFRHGRRWALGTTLATRAFLAWVLASAVVEDSAGSSRPPSAASSPAAPTPSPGRPPCPGLLPGITLVTANSRLTIAGLVGMALGGGLGGCVVPDRAQLARSLRLRLRRLHRGDGARDPAARPGRLDRRGARRRRHAGR